MEETQYSRTQVKPVNSEYADDKGYDAEGQRRRNETYHQKQEARGLVQCRVWVPADATEELRAFAVGLRRIR